MPNDAVDKNNEIAKALGTAAVAIKLLLDNWAAIMAMFALPGGGEETANVG